MSSLTNFITPTALKSRFDAICHAAGRTRTSVLIEMMEGYVLSQGTALAAKTQQLREVDRIIEENRALNAAVEAATDINAETLFARQNRGERIFEPFSPMVDDGLDRWS